MVAVSTSHSSCGSHTLLLLELLLSTLQDLLNPSAPTALQPLVRYVEKSQ
jgi:hypothetical protein